MNEQTSWVSLAAVLSGFVMMTAGCAGGLHQKGDRQISLSAGYGEPIGGQAVWNDGEGTGQNGAVTIGYDHFLDDRLALLAAVTPVRIWNQDDGDVYSAEFQMGLRYFFWEFDLGRVPVGLYAEALGGLTVSAKSVPEKGSNLNFTQDTGVGFEAHLDDKWRWFGGYRLKHLSNGNMFNDDNQSQNNHYVFTGLAYSF